MHIPSEFFLTTIKELPDENIGIGGKTIDKTKREYAEKLNDKWCTCDCIISLDASVSASSWIKLYVMVILY